MSCTNFLAAHEVQFKVSESILVLLQWPGALWVNVCRTGTIFAAQEEGLLALYLLAYQGFLVPACYC